jgi:hypothetical protein
MCLPIAEVLGHDGVHCEVHVVLATHIAHHQHHRVSEPLQHRHQPVLVPVIVPELSNLLTFSVHCLRSGDQGGGVVHQHYVRIVLGRAGSRSRGGSRSCASALVAEGWEEGWRRGSATHRLARGVSGVDLQRGIGRPQCKIVDVGPL